MDEFIQPSNDLSNLPKPGGFVIYDYTEQSCARTNSNGTTVKAVQWNIERAYKLDDIIDLLQNGMTDGKDHANFKTRKLERRKRAFNERSGLAYKDFDVMGIQEFDINCARSGFRNSPLELARALQMRCIFLCEFEELYSAKLRDAKSQGGGVHGNGILTWWEVEKVEVIEHVEIFNWERDGEKLNEPRKGKRCSLACFLRHPRDPTRKILVYSVHLEIFCGIFGRLRQFSQILAHSRANLLQYPQQMILGDLNTMAHGLARLLPKYCCDSMRWRSVGWSEAEWWQRNLFDVLLPGDRTINCSSDRNYFLAAHHHSKKPAEIKRNLAIEQEIENEIEGVESNDIRNNTNSCIFTPEELRNLLNPHFFCPFPLASTRTVQMAGYSGKLDWMLLRGWRVLSFGTDNETYGRSDHKLLWCEIEDIIDDVDENEHVDVGVRAYEEHQKTSRSSRLGNQHPASNAKASSLTTRNRIIISASVVGVAGILLYYLFNSNKQ